MATEDLLKHAHEKKPADFSKEFKAMLSDNIKKALEPKKEETETKDE